mmetsp:Transcript_18648/g.41612  ORF Transcript_18648/g.41612 Transcript_18648/m.41612 type:complete len:600 (+) Transcript_18648:72-1871(+)
MSGRAASVGCVPCTFQVQVHEAISVPPRCEKLRVAWRKGKKVVSTDLAMVQAGIAKWEQDLSIDVMLFRVVRGSQVEVEAKECVLEVRQDSDELVGHAKFDLAEFCTGTVQDRSIMVFRGGTQFVGNMRILVSISVGSSYLAMATRGVAPPRNMFKGVAEVESTPELLPAQPAAFTTAPASGRTSRALSEDYAPTPVIPGLHQPIDVLPAMTPIQSGLCSPALPPELRAFPVLPEPCSAYGTSLTTLPARLVALCNRQCKMSKLSLMEQEDAVRMAFANLRQSYEVTSCGILFSNVSKASGLQTEHTAHKKNAGTTSGNSAASKLAALAATSKIVAGEADSGKVSDEVPPKPGDAANEPEEAVIAEGEATASDDDAQDGQHSTLGPLPSSPNLHLPHNAAVLQADTACDGAALVDAGADASAYVHNCCRSCYELMSLLSDIQSLASTMHADVPLRQVSAQPPELLPEVRNHRLASEESIESSQTDTTPRQMDVVLSNNAAAFSAAALNMGTAISVNGNDEPAVVAQILDGIAQAVLLSKQVVEEVSSDVHALVLKLCEVEQDKKQFAHLWLAHKEMDRAWEVQAEAAQKTVNTIAQRVS